MASQEPGHGRTGPRLAGQPATRSLAYHRVRWMPAATHALIRYGAIGNIAALGPSGRTDDRAHMAWMGAAGYRR